MNRVANENHVHLSLSNAYAEHVAVCGTVKGKSLVPLLTRQTGSEVTLTKTTWFDPIV